MDVSLPDDWAQSRPGYEGSVWYRVGFRLGGEALPDELLALYVERACDNLQVLMNGQLIFSGGRMAEPVSRNCSRPQLVTLPPGLLRPHDNVLDIRVQGHSLDRVASRRDAAGLSRIELGLHSTLLARHAMRFFWADTWPDASSLTLIGVGCVLIAVGWLNRREVYFSYLGWLSLGWAVRSLVSSSSDLPWASGVTEFVLCSFWAVLLALAIQFLLTFAGRRSRSIEDMIALQWVLLPLSLMLGGPERLFDLARIWYVLLSLELLGVVGIYLVITRRQRPKDFGPMALAAAAGTLVLFAELGVQAGLIEQASLSLAEVVVPLLFMAVGMRLFLMFARALRDTEEDRNRVAGQLHRLTAELEARVEQLTAQRVGQFTELERKRIASDLHDDLGAKLLTIVHTNDSTRVSQLAREALDEMRLSVRGLAGKAVRLDDAIADWRAECIDRLGQSNIEGFWENVALVEPPMLSARLHMQLTRVLREAVSNVIKHSGAAHCAIRCTFAENTLRLTVQDDGRGIEADLPLGQGMSTMKRRAKRMNGQCLVESRPGFGVMILLTVPI
jgi:two-component system sensor histidine kinase UhpB